MADPQPAAHPAVRVAVGLVTTASYVVTGAVVGIVFVKLFVPRRGMGWDQMADALGGLMLGAALGLVIGALIAFRLTPRRQMVAVVVAIAMFGVCWLYLYLTRGNAKSASFYSTASSTICCFHERTDSSPSSAPPGAQAFLDRAR